MGGAWCAWDARLVVPTLAAVLANVTPGRRGDKRSPLGRGATSGEQQPIDAMPRPVGTGYPTEP